MYLCDIDRVVRDTVRDRLLNPEFGFDADSISVIISIHDQSSDIARGVTRKKKGKLATGAGTKVMSATLRRDAGNALAPNYSS